MSKFYSSFNKTNICNAIVAIWFSRNRKQIKVNDACIFVKTNKKKVETATQIQYFFNVV